jgi:hypothetical protein
VDFDIRVKLLIGFFAFVRYWEKKKRAYSDTVHQLFIDFKKVYDSVRREVWYNILIEFGIPMKLVAFLILIAAILSPNFATTRW